LFKYLKPLIIRKNDTKALVKPYKSFVKISVIVPTYRRPIHLYNCLTGFKQQIRLADEILLIVRDTDRLTWEFLQSFDSKYLPLKTLIVKVTGVVAAMNLGLDAAQGDIVCFIDDDAVPHNDWLAKIEAHFSADPRLVGLGGRDRMYLQGKNLVEGQKPLVGKLQWFGRMIANHHLGVGKPREVDFLKGVNMSYRREAIANRHFDQRMKGTGAQTHFELSFCLSLKRDGCKLLYDPQIVVEHYLAERFDEDIRDRFNPVAFFNEVHNETLAILEHFSPPRRIMFMAWALLVGTRKAFGLAQLIRFLPQEGKLAFSKWLMSIRGRREGWLSWQESDRSKSRSSNFK
jgi:glycosyltransferase involved in cell wall biosynthesis